MEKNLAILMADLTGYTALTETHGALAAADLIDRYVEIVETCLVGDSRIRERTGDEVMIVSESPDHLLSTAAMIMKHTAKEENFLQVHGGLHYGNVLHRKNSLFGSAVNLTARIAAKAEPGTFWCSGDFVEALANQYAFLLAPKGKHSFKNVNEEMEIAALVYTRTKPTTVDPVCRMQILDTGTAIRHPELDDLHFCSRACLDRYMGITANAASAGCEHC